MSYADESIKNAKHSSQTAITQGGPLDSGSPMGLGKVVKPKVGQNVMAAKGKKKRRVY